MKNIIAIALSTALSLGAFGIEASAIDKDACFRLHQWIETKYVNQPNQEFQLVTEITQTYLSQSVLETYPIIGLVVSWGYKVRGENLFLPGRTLQITDEGLRARVRLEKDDFPMDGTWDLIWQKDVLFKTAEPFTLLRLIEDKYFRITLTWEQADPNHCNPPGWLKPY